MWVHVHRRCTRACSWTIFFVFFFKFKVCWFYHTIDQHYFVLRKYWSETSFTRNPVFRLSSSDFRFEERKAVSSLHTCVRWTTHLFSKLAISLHCFRCVKAMSGAWPRLEVMSERWSIVVETIMGSWILRSDDISWHRSGGHCIQYAKGYTWMHKWHEKTKSAFVIVGSWRHNSFQWDRNGTRVIRESFYSC